jgi:hypothetical protein
MRRSCFIASLTLVSLALPLTAQPVVWPGNGHTYEAIVVSGGITWPAAQQAAMTAGGHLASITSAAENSFVFSLLSDPLCWYGGSGLWIGGIQPPGSPEPAGGWQWSTGEPFSYSNWGAAEPNNAGGEDRIHYWQNSAQWNDLNFGSFLPGYVYEYSPPSSPQYQSNSVLATLTIDGVYGTSYSAATINVPINGVATLALSSTNAGMPWELGFGLAPLLSTSSGALVTPGGQMLNLDLADPSLGTLWNFFQGPGFQSVQIPISVPTPIGVSLQLLVAEPYMPCGVCLSQPTRFIVQ